MQHVLPFAVFCQRCAFGLVLICTNSLWLGAQQPQPISPQPLTKEVKVLSYNIYMLPKIAGNTGQKPRTKALIDVFKSSSYDVLLLQEVFIDKLRDELIAGLKEKYPYVAGPPGDDGLFSEDGGAMVFSRFPILLQKIIVYSNCKGIDCKSDKGAVWAELDLGDGRRMQVISTHAQSEDGTAEQDIRFSQYQQVVDSLLKPYKTPGVPQVLGGDMNTNRYDVEYYARMEEILTMIDTHLPGNEKAYTYHGAVCDLVKKSNVTHNQFLDYIFFAPNGSSISVAKSGVVRPQAQWSDKHKDLSDHFAFEAHLKITWPK